MIKVKDSDVSKFIDFYLSGTISFCFMMNLLQSKSLDFKEIDSFNFSG